MVFREEVKVSNVIRINAKQEAETAVALLDRAKAMNLRAVLVLGITEDGHDFLAASQEINVGDALVLIERMKKVLV